MGDGKRAQAAALGAGNDPVKMAVELARPAVVRISTTVSGRVIVHFPTGDVRFPRTGGRYTLTGWGSGTFISSHGDILTADHVIRPPSQDFAAAAAAEDITTYINQQHLTGMPVTLDQVEQALQDGQLGADAQYDTTSSEVYLSTAYTGPLNALTLQNVPPTIHKTVDRIEAESGFDQRDVAIIHVPFNDTASVQLGDSSTVQELDELTILGFPGNGDVSNRPTDLLTSSVNWVTVSSLKETENRAPVIQVGGNVEHGDSGGPALDSKGTVVGIVSFGLSNGSPGATSFLQASNSARTLVQALHLDTTPGTFQQEWSQALTNYYATTPGHWHKAAQELVRLTTAYPLFQAVTPYLTSAQSQARTERPVAPVPPKPHTPSPWIALPIVAWTAGALALLVVLVFIFFRGPLRFRGKRQIRALAGVHPQDQVIREECDGTWKIDDDARLTAKGATATLTATTAGWQSAKEPVNLVRDSRNNGKIGTLIPLPDKTLDTFCTALQTQAYQTAYDQTSDAFQNTYPASQFAKAVSWVASSTHDVPAASGTLATATVMFGTSSGQTVHYKVTLIQDKNGDWKIDSFQQV
jgi:hypothetical protein